MAKVSYVLRDVGDSRHGRQTAHWYTAEEWRQILEAQRGSGQRQIAFCDAHGLGDSTFQAWKRRLHGVSRSSVSAPTAMTQPSSKAFGPLFTPLTQPVSGSASPVPDAAGWTAELDLGDGVHLRLRRA